MGNRSGTVTPGYVNNSGNSTNVLFLYQPSWPGMLWNDQIGVLNKAASGEAKFNFLAGSGEDLVAALVGKEGAGAGSDGALEVHIKRAGNTPIARFLFADGEVGPSANTKFVIPTSQTPASASATGTTGTIAWDSSFLYVCVSTDSWKRVAIATW